MTPCSRNRSKHAGIDDGHRTEEKMSMYGKVSAHEPEPVFRACNRGHREDPVSRCYFSLICRSCQDRIS